MRIILKKQIDRSLEEDWEYLEKNNNLLIFQTLKWNQGWIKQNNSKNSILIFVVYKDDKVIAIFPFCLEKKMAFKIIKWIGYDTSDYLSPIIDKDNLTNENDFQKIWQEIIINLKKIGDILYLDKQTDNNNNLFNPILKHLNCQTYSYNQLIKLTDWETIKKKKNQSLQQYRRKKKKLSNLGKFEFIKDVDDKDKKNIISKLIQWKKETDKDYSFSKTFVDKFYFEVADYKNLSISALKLDEQYIAGILGFKLLKTYFFLVPSFKFDLKTYKYSPGKILLIELLNSLDKEKIEYFDFCDGNQTYKTEWGNQKVNLKICLQEINFKGLILKSIIKFRKKI